MHKWGLFGSRDHFFTRSYLTRSINYPRPIKSQLICKHVNSCCCCCQSHRAPQPPAYREGDPRRPATKSLQCLWERRRTWITTHLPRTSISRLFARGGNDDSWPPLLISAKAWLRGTQFNLASNNSQLVVAISGAMLSKAGVSNIQRHLSL